MAVQRSSVEKYFTSSYVIFYLLYKHQRNTKSFHEKASKGAIFICNHSNSDLFTCENNMLSSLVKISCFGKHVNLTWYFIGVYIIKLLNSKVLPLFCILPRCTLTYVKVFLLSSI